MATRMHIEICAITWLGFEGCKAKPVTSSVCLDKLKSNSAVAAL